MMISNYKSIIHRSKRRGWISTLYGLAIISLVLFLMNGILLRHYDHPVYEGGKQLVDMIYLQKKL